MPTRSGSSTSTRTVTTTSIFSNDAVYGVYLFESMETGWSRKVMAGKAASPGRCRRSSRDGTDNGFWVHSRHLWWQNEDTAKLPDLVDRRSFADLHSKDVRRPTRQDPAEAARRKVRSASGPGSASNWPRASRWSCDPIAFDWGADGRLWVVEMGDYPLGVDGKGKPGGQVRILEDTDNDGRYDKVDASSSTASGSRRASCPGGTACSSPAPRTFFTPRTATATARPTSARCCSPGFTQGNQQHRVNGFELGLDGWVYGANGDSGGVVRSIKTGKSGRHPRP